MTDRAVRLDYFFDPFCGWCYAGAPALAALAESYPDALAMQPSGLFANGGTRSMASMADHAWRNDMRIAELTGRTFTSAYRDRVLRDTQALFDSTHATRAIVALGAMDAGLEPALLQALQTARFIDAKDTARAEVVAAVAADLARSHGQAVDADTLADRLRHDNDLASRTGDRIRRAVLLMQDLPGTGVPQLLVGIGGHSEVVHGADLYGGASVVLQAVERVAATARSRPH